MNGAPFAPWSLRGETMVGFSRRHPPGQLPQGVTRLAGPAMLTASRFTRSPVGPFLQFGVAVPARIGGRGGWCVVLLVVDRQDARIGCRLNWGFPAEMGRLRWRCDDDRWELVWDDRELAVRGSGRGPKIPMAVPHREIQQRNDGPVVVPDRLLGRFQPAGVRLQTLPGDDLARLAGRHAGTLVWGADRLVQEARTPVGLIAPLRAPAASPEPMRSDLPQAS